MKKIVLLSLSIFLFLAFTAKDYDAEKDMKESVRMYDIWRKTEVLVKTKIL